MSSLFFKLINSVSSLVLVTPLAIPSCTNLFPEKRRAFIRAKASLDMDSLGFDKKGIICTWNLCGWERVYKMQGWLHKPYMQDIIMICKHDKIRNRKTEETTKRASILLVRINPKLLCHQLKSPVAQMVSVYQKVLGSKQSLVRFMTFSVFLCFNFYNSLMSAYDNNEHILLLQKSILLIVLL